MSHKHVHKHDHKNDHKHVHKHDHKNDHKHVHKHDHKNDHKHDHKHHKHDKHKKDRCFCDKPTKFHDKIGKGTHDSTPIIVPPDFNAETGSSLNPVITIDNTHPGPFAGASFAPSSQQFQGLFPRRNTPNKSQEKGGKILMDIRHGFYRPRAKVVHSNFAKKAMESNIDVE